MTGNEMRSREALIYRCDSLEEELTRIRKEDADLVALLIKIRDLIDSNVNTLV